MPRATVDPSPQRFDLKTLPEGYVSLRRMPYGDWLHRQELAMRLKVEASRQGGKADMAGEMQMANKAVTVYEFSRCVVEHNLEDDQGNTLDFNNPAALEALDAKIGNEVAQYIMELHEFDSGNSSSGSVPLSS